MRGVLAGLLAAALLAIAPAASAQSIRQGPSAAGGGASGANPTATIGTAAVNGVAPTFMRSDAAPALPAGTGTGSLVFATSPSLVTPALGAATATSIAAAGAASSINDSSNFNTNINTGSSTGTAAIGNVLALVTITSTSAGSWTWNADTTLCRLSSAILQIGNGSCGNSGGLSVSKLSGATGHVFMNDGSNPAVSGTGLGTAPSITSNGSIAMDITVGTSPAAATFTITFAAAFGGWVCTGADITNPGATNIKQAGTGSTTTAILENFNSSGTATALTAADHLRIMCVGY